MKSTVAKVIVAPVTQRNFVYKEVHPTTFREEPKKSALNAKKRGCLKIHLDAAIIPAGAAFMPLGADPPPADAMNGVPTVEIKPSSVF